MAIIKPDGLAGNHTNKIKEIILDSGFSISKEMIVQLDEDSVKRFYVEHSSKSFFPSLLKYMTRYFTLYRLVYLSDISPLTFT